MPILHQIPNTRFETPLSYFSGTVSCGGGEKGNRVDSVVVHAGGLLNNAQRHGEPAGLIATIVLLDCLCAFRRSHHVLPFNTCDRSP